MRIAAICSITVVVFAWIRAGRKRIQRLSTAGLRVAQNRAAMTAVVSSAEASSVNSERLAPMKNTATIPINAIHTVDRAPEMTKNQAHRPAEAPQLRCTRNVSQAESAGPPGMVVDQAFDASVIEVHGPRLVMRRSVLSRICMTKAIARIAPNAARTAPSKGSGLAWAMARHAWPRKGSWSRNAISAATRTTTGAIQRNHCLAFKFALLQLFELFALLDAVHQFVERHQVFVFFHGHACTGRCLAFRLRGKICSAAAFAEAVVGAFDPARGPPVVFLQQVHHGRDQQEADDGGVEREGEDHAEGNVFHHHDVRHCEGGGDDDHDGGGGGDDSAGVGGAVFDGFVCACLVVACFYHAGD